MNQSQLVEATSPDPQAPARLRLVIRPADGDSIRLPAGRPLPALLGGLVAVPWPVARLLASSVRVVRNGRSVMAHNGKGGTP